MKGCSHLKRLIFKFLSLFCKENVNSTFKTAVINQLEKYSSRRWSFWSAREILWCIVTRCLFNIFNIFKSWLSIQLAIYQCNVVHIAFDFNILGFRGTCTKGIQYDNNTVSNLKERRYVFALQS